jgi:hypothetical protein
LIAAGHSPRDVMEYTPRQIQAFEFIAERRQKGDLAWTLVLGVLAARGDEKAIRGQLKEFDDG